MDLISQFRQLKSKRWRSHVDDDDGDNAGGDDDGDEF